MWNKNIYFISNTIILVVFYVYNWNSKLILANIQTLILPFLLFLILLILPFLLFLIPFQNCVKEELFWSLIVSIASSWLGVNLIFEKSYWYSYYRGQKFHCLNWWLEDKKFCKEGPHYWHISISPCEKSQWSPKILKGHQLFGHRLQANTKEGLINKFFGSYTTFTYFSSFTKISCASMVESSLLQRRTFLSISKLIIGSNIP